MTDDPKRPSKSDRPSPERLLELGRKGVPTRTLRRIVGRQPAQRVRRILGLEHAPTRCFDKVPLDVDGWEKLVIGTGKSRLLRLKVAAANAHRADPPTPELHIVFAFRPLTLRSIRTGDIRVVEREDGTSKVELRVNPKDPWLARSMVPDARALEGVRAACNARAAHLHAGLRSTPLLAS